MSGAYLFSLVSQGDGGMLKKKGGGGGRIDPPGLGHFLGALFPLAPMRIFMTYLGKGVEVPSLKNKTKQHKTFLVASLCAY